MTPEDIDEDRTLVACTVLLYFAFNDRPRLEGTLLATTAEP